MSLRTRAFSPRIFSYWAASSHIGSCALVVFDRFFLSPSCLVSQDAPGTENRLTDAAPVENNRHLNLICPSSGKTVKVPRQRGRADNGHPCTLYGVFTYYDDDVIIHIIAFSIIIIIQWPLFWGGTPCDRWEPHLSDCFMLHNSPAILSLYWDGLLSEQRQPDHNLSVYLVAMYHQSSLPVLLGPNYLWSWQYGITCLVTNATITIKALLSWMGRQRKFWLVKNSIN